MARTLFIGRFQPLHNGHRHAIEQAQEQHDLIIGIGSAETHHTFHNPLTFDEREAIFHACLDQPEVRAIPDQDSDPDWMDWIEQRFDVDTCISGNDHVRRLFRERGFTVLHPAYLDPDRYSGTRIRERAAQAKEWQHLVPDCCLEKLQDIGFQQRLQTIYENDG
ncbi:MAG: adenylyltransferase/cytidyltransferase family protein [Candidatus Nanohaloarchaea archaeon]|nr:adenylyltransferase/cytidyltransferase family protein [Candidatus Nanohaloarchaea archaeon]